MHDEQTLVEAARQGDRDAFAALYDRFAPLIRAICFDLTGDSAACDDLAQDVFLRYEESSRLLPAAFVSLLHAPGSARAVWPAARVSVPCLLAPQVISCRMSGRKCARECRRGRIIG